MTSQKSGRQRTFVPTDEQAEICALWPETPVNTLSKRFGYSSRNVRRILSIRYGVDLRAARLSLGYTPYPGDEANARGHVKRVETLRRNKRAAEALQRCEDQMLSFWSGV